MYKNAPFVIIIRHTRGRCVVQMLQTICLAAELLVPVALDVADVLAGVRLVRHLGPRVNILHYEYN